MNLNFDAIVVGSGISGRWTARPTDSQYEHHRDLIRSRSRKWNYLLLESKNIRWHK